MSLHNSLLVTKRYPLLSRSEDRRSWGSITTHCCVNTTVHLRTSGEQLRKDLQILVEIVQLFATQPKKCLKLARGDRGTSWYASVCVV